MSTTYTNLSVTNQTDKSVPVYVTFAAKNAGNACAPTPMSPGDFNFLSPVNKLMGTFTLEAGATQLFETNGDCFSGNICFYIEPQCPIAGADFNNGEFGTSIAEFTINPNEGCVEAIDISCVNGVNSYILMKTGKNEGWTYGPSGTSIDKIHNNALGQNAGNPGVYPVNCTDCIGLVGNAPCPTLPVGPAQTERICNVQRSQRGGTVEVFLRNPHEM